MRAPIFLLLFLPLCLVAESPETEEGPDSALVRLAISVTDIERSKRFYSYGLGYRIGYDGDITRPSVIDMLQLREGQTAWFVVLHSDEAIEGVDLPAAMIGLIHIDNPPLPVMQRPAGAGLASGEGILAIMTSDISLVYERLLELDSTIVYAPTRSADGSESELVVYDPDGIRIHVVQRHATLSD